MDTVMYRVECFFCGTVHSSEYWDDVDAAIEKCRRQASVADQGRLEAYADYQTYPVLCELEVPLWHKEAA